MKTILQTWFGLGAAALLASGSGTACWAGEATNIQGAVDQAPLATTNSALASTNTAAPPLVRVPPTSLATSPGLSDVVKLAQSGMDENVVLSYIDHSQIAYQPTAAEIVYLRDIGVSSKVITRLLERGQQVGAQAQSASIAATAEATAAPAPAGSANPSVPSAPTSTVAAPMTVPAYAQAPSGVGVPPGPVPLTAPQEVVAPPPDATATPFYSDLSPYGTWMDVPDYGWCWQPTIVNTDPFWRPYYDGGHWLYSDYGWYWGSVYSWGAVPFHYGRWFWYPSSGWLWRPDTVWGPSWVCWRNAPGYYGWAPLPPGAIWAHGGLYYGGVAVGIGFDFGLSAAYFSFVDYGHFAGGHYRHDGVWGHRAGGIWEHSRADNRYVSGPNNRVINQGPNPRTIAAASRQEIRKVSVRDLPPAAGKFTAPDRLEKAGNSWVVYRAPISTVPNRSSSLPQGARVGNPGVTPATPLKSSSTLISGTANRNGAAPANYRGPSESVTRSTERGIPITRVDPITPPLRAETTARQTPQVTPTPSPSVKWQGWPSSAVTSPSPSSPRIAQRGIGTWSSPLLAEREPTVVTAPKAPERPMGAAPSINPAPTVITPHPVWSQRINPVDRSGPAPPKPSPDLSRTIPWGSPTRSSAPALPAYSAPSSRPYAAPYQRSYTAPARAYSFPAERPAYRAPAPSGNFYRSQPAPSYARPSYSAPTPSYSRPAGGIQSAGARGGSSRDR